jgi:hypothetical protein
MLQFNSQKYANKYDTITFNMYSLRLRLRCIIVKLHCWVSNAKYTRKNLQTKMEDNMK